MLNRRSLIKRGIGSLGVLAFSGFPTSSLAGKIVVGITKEEENLLHIQEMLLSSMARKINRDKLYLNNVDSAYASYDFNLQPEYKRHGWRTVVEYSDGKRIGSSVDVLKTMLPENVDIEKVANSLEKKLKRIAVGNFADVPNFQKMLKFEGQFAELNLSKSYHNFIQIN